VTLVIDPARCQGHGRCQLTNPEVFEVSDDGIGVVLLPQPPESARADVERAIGNCPEQAIHRSERSASDSASIP
jgi:ferredoxin